MVQTNYKLVSTTKIQYHWKLGPKKIGKSYILNIFLRNFRISEISRDKSVFMAEE